MFSSKKRNLPPRANLPASDQMIDDIKNCCFTDINDFVNNRLQSTGLHFPSNINDNDNIYWKAKRYLDSIGKLKELSESINNEKVLLANNNDEINDLVQQIKSQAEIALIN